MACGELLKQSTYIYIYIYIYCRMVLLLVFHFIIRCGINNAETYIHKTGWQVLDSSDFGQGHIAGCCVHSNELCMSDV